MLTHLTKGTRMSTKTCNRGFSMIELVIVIGIVAFLTAISVAAVDMTKERDNRVKCAKNLRLIGTGMMMYANENKGIYPRTKFESGVKVIPDVSNGGFDSADPFVDGTKVPANCVPSALFLLLKSQDMATSSFICPSTDQVADKYANPRSDQKRSNFTDIAKNLSYGYANPYPNNEAIGGGYGLKDTMDPGIAVVSDRGTSDSDALMALSGASSEVQKRSANSPNHAQAGQNVLYADGHVDFQDSALAGHNMHDKVLDNIYIRGAGPTTSKDDLLNSPKDWADSVILPLSVKKP